MKENILLIYGGNSVEHEISIISALQIKNYYYGKYNLILCYLKNAKFYIDDRLNDIKTYNDFDSLKIKEVNFKANSLYVKCKNKKIPFVATFLLVHGKNCEDGTLSSFFKTLNIPCICQSIYYSCIGQDKILSKKLCGVECLPFTKIDKDDLKNIETLFEKAGNLKYPLILKPSKLGSSIGICIIKNKDELIDKINELLYLDDSVLIENCLEKFIELNVALIKYKNEYILSEIEKVSENVVLSYNDKYVNESNSLQGTKKELPANIPQSLKNKIYNNAIQVYKNLNASLIVRIDYLYDLKTSTLYFNEINNIPGSLAFYLFNKNKIDTSTLIEMCVSQGLADIEKEKLLIDSYDQNILSINTLDNVKKFK